MGNKFGFFGKNNKSYVFLVFFNFNDIFIVLLELKRKINLIYSLLIQ